MTPTMSATPALVPALRDIEMSKRTEALWFLRAAIGQIKAYRMANCDAAKTEHMRNAGMFERTAEGILGGPTTKLVRYLERRGEFVS